MEERSTPATFTVTTATDTGTGAGNSGDLRYCLAQANANVDADTIQFDPGFFNVSTPRTIKLAGGPLNIATKITINGPGQAIVTLSGEFTTNVLTISTPSATDPVSLSGLTIARGKKTTIGVFGAGISILKADVTATNLTISQCFNVDSGGGLGLVAGKLTGSFLSIVNNAVDAQTYCFGAGVFAGGNAALQLTNCTISNNLATATSGKYSCVGAGVADATSGDVILQDCTMTGNTNSQFGGGVYVANVTPGGNLSLIGCTISKNTVEFAGGGVGVSSDTANISIQNCTFDRNTAVNSGGALAVLTGNPTITITNSEFTNNDCVAGPGGVFTTFNISAPTVVVNNSSFIGNTASANPGGVFYSQTAGALSLQIDNSTFANNVASTGGVISVAPFLVAGGNVSITNSTLVNNSTGISGNGGAIALGGGFAGSFQLSNSTVVNNNAGSGGGGGISVTTKQIGCNVTIVNSIVADNTVAGSGNVDTADIARSFANPTITVDFSLIGVVPTTPPFTVPTPGSNKTGTAALPKNPNLRPLANYGGTTWTRPPLPGSEAVNNGKAAAIANDQRGAGFPRNVGGFVDMGAVEENVALPWVSATSAANISANSSATYEFTISFSDTNAVDNTTLGAAGAITVRGPGFSTPAVATLKTPIGSPGPTLTPTYLLTPPGGSWDVSDNGVYTISVTGGTIFDTDGTKHSVTADDYATFTVAIPISLVVNSKNDEIIDTDGLLSFREATQKANLSLGNDTIDFSPVVFASDQTISLALTAIVITDGVTIRGPANSTLTLDAEGSSHHMMIGGPGQFNVSISNLTMVNGVRVGAGAGLNGGAIVIGDENVTLTACTFKDNSSEFDGGAVAQLASGNLTITNCVFDSNLITIGSKRTGGAIFYNGSGKLNISRSTFSKNQSQGGGGAISLAGSPIVTIDQCTISQNTTVGGPGAAIRSIMIAPGTLSITNTTINNNATGGTSGNGGGIALDGVTATTTISNVTLSSNSAKVAGGGIWLNNLAGPFTLQNSTLSLNTAQDSVLGGGGIANTYLQVGGSITISSSIIAQNTASAGLPRDISSDAAITIAGNNDLIGVADIGKFSLSGTGHKNGTEALPQNAKLLPLASNGGPTQTHVPMSDSQAINNGLTNGLATDQRGNVRTVGGNPDIGSVERNSTAPTITSVVINNGDARRSMVTSMTVTFDQVVAMDAGAIDLARFDKGTTGSVLLNQVTSGNIVTLTFMKQSPSAGKIDIDLGGSLADGQYKLTVDKTKVHGDSGDLIATSVTSLWRLFGDTTNEVDPTGVAPSDGNVIAGDFANFRRVFGTTSTPGSLAAQLDFDGNGTVDAGDFAEFRKRFGLTGYVV